MGKKTGVWAKVELMGHKVVAGRISAKEIAGQPFLEVKIPRCEVGGNIYMPLTQFYGAAAIYCITPIDEDGALGIAREEAWRGNNGQKHFPAHGLLDKAPERGPQEDGIPF